VRWAQQYSTRALGKNLHQARVAIQGSRVDDLYVLVFLEDTLYNGGQVTLQMRSRSEEVGDDDDPLHALGDEEIGSLFQGGRAELQEGGFDDWVAARASEVGRHRADGLIGRFDSGAVGEDDDCSGHALLM
jgi:hypothetical protein